MKHVLFVDDEPAVLDGLRRMLRSMRHEWQATFVTSGAQALALLDRQAIDVIVTDMRMPDMDGAQLLDEVMRRHREVVRIILSGQVDRESALRALGPTHQYLSKPCEEQPLKATISRALMLRQWSLEPTIKHVVAGVSALPYHPSLYTKLTDELQRPDCSIKRAGELLSQDVGMAAKIMQLVNSAYFGLRQRAGTPAEAAALLGLDALRMLVPSPHVFGRCHHVNSRCCDIDRLFHHSVEVGLLAKQLAQAEGASAADANDAHTAGLLHDVGKLLLASQMEQQYLEVAEIAAREQIGLVAAEQSVLGCSHAEVGAYLLGLWGLPDSIVDAVAFHHADPCSPSPDQRLIGLVHLADQLIHERAATVGQSPSCEPDEFAVLTTGSLAH